MATIRRAAVDWAVAGAALAGQSDSGDHHVVQPFRDGVIVAVLDGVGHGPQAAAAARTASKVLEQHPDDPPIVLVRRCHEELRSSRGVVMSLASFDFGHDLMTWLGVGNVEGVLLRGSATISGAEESLLLRAGVVGVRLPELQASVLTVHLGDTLVLTTDGVSRDFARRLACTQAPQKAADSILAGYARKHDDALVMVARYLGSR